MDTTNTFQAAAEMAPSTPTSFTTAVTPTGTNSLAATSTPPNDAPAGGLPGDSSSENTPNHAAMISGLVCGAGLVVGILCALGWMSRHRIRVWCISLRSKTRMRRTDRTFKLQSVGNTPSTNGSEWSVQRNTRSRPSAAATKTAALHRSPSTDWVRHDFRQGSAVTVVTAPEGNSRVGLGLSDGHEGGSATAQPFGVDIRSTTGPRAQVAVESMPLWQNSSPQYQQQTPVAVQRLEATLQRFPPHYLNCSLPTFSTPGTMPPPVTPATSSNGNPGVYSVPTFSTPSSMPMPVTPASHSNASTSQTPSTLGGQPVWQPQQSTPFQYHHQRPEAVYTPSLYQPHPPTSLPYAARRPGAPIPGSAYSHAGQPSLSTIASLPSQQLTNPFINKPHLAPSPPKFPAPATTNQGSSSLTTTTTTNHPLAQPASAISLGSTASLYRHIDSNLNLYRELSALPPSPPKAHVNPFTDASSLALPTTGTASDAERPDVYRGLSSRSARTGGKNEGLPWDMLRAEDALGGGWRNWDGESGWEDVGEESEEDERDDGSPQKKGT